MSRERHPLLHLARGVDELLRAAADVAEILLERVEGPALEALREALRGEAARWDSRAEGDPAAAGVRELVAALLDVLAPA